MGDEVDRAPRRRARPIRRGSGGGRARSRRAGSAGPSPTSRSAGCRHRGRSARTGRRYPVSSSISSGANSSTLSATAARRGPEGRGQGRDRRARHVLDLARVGGHAPAVQSMPADMDKIGAPVKESAAQGEPHDRHPFRPLAHRLPPRGQPAHRAVQLPDRAQGRRARSSCGSTTPTPNGRRRSMSTGSSEDLTWLGMTWDRDGAAVARGSTAMPRPRTAARRWAGSTRGSRRPTELDLKRKKQLNMGKPPVYDRAALSLTEAERDRLRAERGTGRTGASCSTRSGSSGTDGILGPISIDAASVSDPVLIRPTDRCSIRWPRSSTTSTWA